LNDRHQNASASASRSYISIKIKNENMPCNRVRREYLKEGAAHLGKRNSSYRN
jgi:hypothetical protein